MKRWLIDENKYIESAKIDEFVKEIDKLSKKFNLSISHEDGHGAFIVEEYKEDNIEWLNSCNIGG